MQREMERAMKRNSPLRVKSRSPVGHPVNYSSNLREPIKCSDAYDAPRL